MGFILSSLRLKRSVSFISLNPQRVRSHDENCCCSCNYDTNATDAAEENGTQVNVGTNTSCVFIRRDNSKDIEQSSSIPDLKQCRSYDTAETAETTCLSAAEYEVDFHNSGMGDDDDEEIECPICMCAFEVDDIVSWSFQPECQHVFHHQCIKEWLLRRSCCPFCRSVYMPVDEFDGKQVADDDERGGKLSKSKHGQLMCERLERSTMTYYCHKGGLVTLERPESNEKDQMALWEKKRQQLTASKLFRGELIQLRGDKVAADNASSEGEVTEQMIVIQVDSGTGDDDSGSNEDGESEHDMEASRNSVLVLPL